MHVVSTIRAEKCELCLRGLHATVCDNYTIPAIGSCAIENNFENTWSNLKKLHFLVQAHMVANTVNIKSS